MKRVWIVNIGNELLGRGVINSNGEWIAAQFESKGWEIAEIRIISDGYSALQNSWDTRPNNIDCVVFSGGLGPTPDDTTRFDVAKLMGTNVELNKDLFEGIKNVLGERRFLEFKKINEVQAKLPKEAVSIMNSVGTACGFKVSHCNIDLFFTPGVPFEMKVMINQEILPLLESGVASLKKELVSFGIGESLQTELLKNIQFDYPFSFASLPGPKGLRLRLTLFEDDATKLNAKWDEVLSALEKHKRCIISLGDESLLGVVSKFLLLSNVKLGVAESCTGGMLGAIITEEPGSSAFFEGGVVSYSNNVKERTLSVCKKLLNDKGAVSQEVSEEMVLGITKFLGCDAGISITGIAGPRGGSVAKPVGTVWIAVSFGSVVYSKMLTLRGDRERVRLRSCWESLNFFREKFIV